MAGALRGVGATPNTFATERMIDELAKDAGKDPLAYRKSLIKDDRLMTVLDAVAARANWGKKLPAGSAQGISLGIYDTTRFACIAEASVTPAGKITVNRVTVVADPGIVVDHGSCHAQIEGGAIFGISNLLHGGIDIVGGGTAQANLDTTHFTALQRRCGDRHRADLHGQHPEPWVRSEPSGGRRGRRALSQPQASGQQSTVRAVDLIRVRTTDRHGRF